MVDKQDVMDFPFRPIISGAMAVILMFLVFTALIGIFTGFGWTGTIKWSGSLYLIIAYLSVVVGSIIGGLKSGRMGWITGVGIGITSSIFILLLAIIVGEPVSWPVFLIKVIVNSFIGAFGGIIGVNFSNGD